jgi:phosphatidylethanolamine-binding protein (PEBP) family uncharacterized protein
MTSRRLMTSLVTAVALAGCGSSHSIGVDATSGSTITAEESPGPSDPSSTGGEMSLSSPAFQGGRRLANGERMIEAQYTCDGRNISSPMAWKGVPKNTAELVLLILDFTASKPRRQFAWAVAGISPSVDDLRVGTVPRGAVVGLNGFGQARYSVCPPHGRQDTYIVFLYALPHRVSVGPGFDANKLYEQIGGSNLPQAQSGFAYRRL